MRTSVWKPSRTSAESRVHDRAELGNRRGTSFTPAHSIPLPGLESARPESEQDRTTAHGVERGYVLLQDRAASPRPLRLGSELVIRAEQREKQRTHRLSSRVLSEPVPSCWNASRVFSVAHVIDSTGRQKGSQGQRPRRGTCLVAARAMPKPTTLQETGGTSPSRLSGLAAAKVAPADAPSPVQVAVTARRKSSCKGCSRSRRARLHLRSC